MQMTTEERVAIDRALEFDADVMRNLPSVIRENARKARENAQPNRQWVIRDADGKRYGKAHSSPDSGLLALIAYSDTFLYSHLELVEERV